MRREKPLGKDPSGTGDRKRGDDPTGALPLGAALAGYYPAPNVTGASALTSPNYVSTQTSYRSNYPSWDVRIDHKLGANDTINAIYFQAGLTQSYPLQGFPGKLQFTIVQAQSVPHGFQHLGTAGMHDPGVNLIACHAVLSEKGIHIAAQIFSYDCRNVGR